LTTIIESDDAREHADSLDNGACEIVVSESVLKKKKKKAKKQRRVRNDK
jgi:hypothetical protein